NFETIKAFGSEERIVGRYRGALKDYARAAVKSNTSLQLLNAIQSLVLNVGRLTIVGLAGWQLVNHVLKPGDGTACILIVSTVYAPLGMLGSNYRMIRQAFVDMEQMLDLRSTLPDIRDAPHAHDLPPASGKGADLVFEHVGFRHTARSVGLDDVSFRV